MVIGECYSTKKDAVIGHEKWLKVMLDGPLPDVLVDCQNSEISQMCDTFGAQMTFERKNN